MHLFDKQEEQEVESDVFEKQNTLSEILDVSDMRIFVLILISFFAAIAALTYKTVHYEAQTPKSLDINTTVLQKVHYYIIANNISKNIYNKLLEYRFLPDQKEDNKPCHWNVKVHAIYFDENDNVMKEIENRNWHVFNSNETFKALHYSYLRNATSIEVSSHGDAYREWLKRIEARWVVTIESAYKIALRIHSIFCIAYLFCYPVFLYFSLHHHLKTRAKLIAFIIPFGIISEIPYENLGINIHLSDALRDAFFAAVFGLIMLFSAFRINEFQLSSINAKKKKKAYTISVLLMLFGIYGAITSQLTLFSFPSLPDSSDPDDEDMLLRNGFFFFTIYGFYQIYTAVEEKMSKKRGEEYDRFMAQNYLFFFAVIVYVGISFLEIKKKASLPNPVYKALKHGVWHLLLYVEAVFSAQTHNSSAEDNFEFDVDGDQINQKIIEFSIPSNDDEKEEEEKADNVDEKVENSNIENPQQIIDDNTEQTNNEVKPENVEQNESEKPQNGESLDNAAPIELLVEEKQNEKEGEEVQTA